ncbi:MULTISPECIES: NADPH dehydrogenase NamA [unclassified Pseudoalteromonas]|uniref:NADPH dehydrogenase NamA n=1 Tax=unclassified Pseudoalteromonas TaxID=194690 RepID=UPI00235A1392|nr:MULTISPECIES: NADPH dehydrogenase NamA [unclassified Pseudoalteromonas]MDC9564032.1 NADPH dehydrogenase NamA [Pseudoalteromonas sp. GAB2316C]MDC9568489.1 NADPH dehydrogenase NamA [Pseudoalteromonas sp. GABNB9D]MDC9572829.1 NADPH dehydrogenase NamA [Pseudoalteromonas sp. GABNS16A]MDC9577070.1 NADPH dehydrogenase NamA [Pseudoalteromonas sp. GABNS16E]MDC9584565.1 NADPH dehydrogenase NamA [Pseudoalteromonas sp. GABNS16C]
MSTLLFEPITINGIEFRNRIAMSPMCMHSASDNGHINDFHVVHYGARALGGADLIMLETASVLPNGPIGPGDIGIWDDSHIEGLARVTSAIHRFGSKAGAQIGHAGRQLGIDLPSIAPSAIPFTSDSRVPQAMTVDQIKEVIEAFRQGARRAREAGFDVIEIHCAHGYLLNQFLSPLANKRADEYGGNQENRYRIVREVIDVVRSEWDGPLFLRISSTDYAEGGNRPEDFLVYGKWMKEQGIDLIDCSTGGIAMVDVNTYPNYQVPAAELLRRELDIKTGAVGLIETGRQAEEILQNGRADFVFVGRDMLKDPFWARTAADDLKVAISVPPQYTRYGSGWQRSQPRLPAAPLGITVECTNT